MAKPTRFLIINSHPIQYFAPLYREMAITPGFDVTVLYCSSHGLEGELDRQFGTSVQWDIPLLAGYRHVFLSNQSLRPSIYSFWGLFNLSVIKQLWQSPKSTVIVYGWAYAVCWLTIFFAKLAGHQVCLRAESPVDLEKRKTGWRKWVRQWVLKQGLFRFVDRFLYIGEQNKEFYKLFGVTDNQLIFCPYSVDNERFNKQYTILTAKRNELREQMGVSPDQFVILYSGKYVSKKKPLDLLQAVATISRNDIVTVLMGDGELRPSIAAFVEQHQLSNVMLTGFVNQSTVGVYYTIADVYVMCSTEEETWGLSTNEAMNFRLPLVMSDAVGCVDDLVQPGQNGYRYTCGNIDELASMLLLMVDMPAPLRSQMGQASKTLIGMYSYAQTISNLRTALAEPLL